MLKELIDRRLDDHFVYFKSWNFNYPGRKCLDRLSQLKIVASHVRDSDEF